MFLRIARQADPGFDIGGNEGALAEVCRLLDGSPLAIELAAARVRLVGVEALRDSLESSLEMLRTTAPDVPERQRALATTIAWSHDRLEEGARRLCRRLVIFEHAFTLEAIEAAADDAVAGDVIELLTQVMEAGLIRPLIGRVRIGFVMPVTVRTFVRRLVSDQRDNDPARLALAAYLLDHVTRWRGDLDRADGPLALARFQDVGLDVHASIEAALRLGRIEEGVTLTLASGPFWVAAGESRQGLARARTVLKHVAGSSQEAGRLHELAARLAYHLDEKDDALAEFARAEAIAEPLGDEATVASSQMFTGGILLVAGEVERGAELVRLGADTATRLGLYPLVAEALSARAIGHAVAGEFEDERATHLARLVVAREHGDVARTADALVVLAEIALDEADAATARAYAEEALSIAQPGLPVEAREALIALSRAQLTEGDATAATVTLGQAFEAAEKIGQKLAIAQCYRVAGCLAAAHGDAASAVRLFAAAQRVDPSPSGTDDPVEGDLAGGLDAARSSLGPEAFTREWTVGSALPTTRVRELLHTGHGRRHGVNPVVTETVNAYASHRISRRTLGGGHAERASIDGEGGIDRPLATGMVVVATPETASALPAICSQVQPQRHHLAARGSAAEWNVPANWAAAGVPAGRRHRLHRHQRRRRDAPAAPRTSTSCTSPAGQLQSTRATRSSSTARPSRWWRRAPASTSWVRWCGAGTTPVQANVSISASPTATTILSSDPTTGGGQPPPADKGDLVVEGHASIAGTRGVGVAGGYRMTVAAGGCSACSPAPGWPPTTARR